MRVTWLKCLCLIGGIWATYATAENALTEEELSIEAQALDGQLVPISAAEVTDVVLEGIVQHGYQDEKGRYIVDVLEKESVYLGILITTPDGRPVVGAMPDIAISGTSRLELENIVTNEDGLMSFGVVAGQMGLDNIVAKIGEAKVEFSINVISLRAAGFPQPELVEGAVSWSDLMSARLDYDDQGMVATFPQAIKDKAGQLVKISGFMLPLQPDMEQSHFLLTSNPPSCFFHIPGGPAGSVEVVASEGIAVSWNPILIEGKFEPLERSDYGVVYRLVDAKVVDP